ncbi:Predicted Peptidoglycan domain-containing protein [Faunimonas pinastri]|uniref:Predicted Peptidoglycan domain-containing protein n=1 Tax=Faunimonas pinastri TaxID=1855383 RepID=A0A1H9N1S9_9HYPH|nr:glycosyl hydrolase 108 family protein [Faunimonas pinastri]SER29737.1 Predicted Peptidoglycan domain-containing protein [Faunimonas pinastri]
MQTVDQMIDDIIKREGGYNEVRGDAGGATNLGVSLRYAKGKPEMDLDHDGDIDKHDIMLVTPEIAHRLYKRDFFQAPGIDGFPDVLQPQLFDISVNAGGGRSIKCLQEALNACAKAGLKVDGYSGPKTEAAAANAVARLGAKTVVNQIVAERIEFYQSIVAHDASQSKFLKGWTNRAKSFLQ